MITPHEPCEPTAERNSRNQASAPTPAQALPLALLDGYPHNTACIRYRDSNGVATDWFVGASQANDDEHTLHAHLERHRPGAEFIGYAIK